MNALDIARKKMGRWRILSTLYTARPIPVGDGLLADVLNDVDLQMTQTEIRSAIQYLSDKNYVEYKDKQNADGKYWECRLRAHGVDFIEYNAPDDNGVSRPSQG